MKFKFDEQGHVVWTPKELYQMVVEGPLRLVNDYLMGGSTPKALDEYAQYRDFVHAVAERTGVHPRNLYLRGSCQIGFSIAPRADARLATAEGVGTKGKTASGQAGREGGRLGVCGWGQRSGRGGLG